MFKIFKMTNMIKMIKMIKMKLSILGWRKSHCVYLEMALLLLFMFDVKHGCGGNYFTTS